MSDMFARGVIIDRRVSALISAMSVFL